MVSPLLLILYLTLPMLFLFLLFKNQRTLKNQNFPPGPRGLPIIGNLYQLDNSSLYLQFWQLSKKYGPLFSLQLGMRPAIVISSAKLAKETLKNHDIVFSGRPHLIGQQKLIYNGLGMAFSQYGAYWREIRKICVAHVLSTKRVSSFSSIRQYEVKQFIKKISKHASSSKVINLNETLMSLTSTIICRTVFGRRYEDEDVERSKFHGLFTEFQAIFVAFFFSDYVPFLGWIDRINGLYARVEWIFKELDEFYNEIINEHMDPNRNTFEKEDIIDVLLQLRKQRLFSFDLTYNHIKAVLMEMLIAATDTTSATSIWIMTELMKNPSVMKRVQQEIKSLGNKKEFIYEEEIKNLFYFKAIIKEILRLHPPAPLLLPKETTEKCIIDEYEIPAKTLVYVNVWAIHRDSEIWEDPEKFHPERFLDNKAAEFYRQDFEFIPFGAGRRICPGIHMAIATIDLIIANLLYSFDWELPIGIEPEDIDVEMLPGITQHKKNPLLLVAKNHM